MLAFADAQKQPSIPFASHQIMAGLTSFLLVAAAAFRRSPLRSKTGVEDSSTGDTTLLVHEMRELSHVMIGSSRFTALKRIPIRFGLHGKP